jgi:DNA polymerase-3 subunit alpha
MHSILAARTDFSLGESILTTQGLVDAAKDAGETAVALTDTMSITGMIDFTNRAKKAGLKPIIGTRLRLTDDPTWRPQKGQKKKDMPRAYFLTAYAMSEAGMKALFRLLTLGNSDERFYYVPKLGFEDLYAELDSLGENDLAIVLGDEHSVLTHPKVHDIVERLGGALPNRIYVPFIPIDTPYYGRMNKIAAEIYDTWAVSSVVVRPAFYGQGEADTQEVMTGIAEGTKLADPWFRSRYKRDLHAMGLKEMMPELKAAISHLQKRGVADAATLFTDGLKNTDILVNSINYEWKKADVSLPQLAPDEFKAVTDECMKGWKERFSAEVFGHKPTGEELKEVYMPRLKYELSVLKRLNFSGYFLLVQDIVQFSKQNHILVGPGRGSVGGSLVAYLMGITDCDPIRFDLMFERFINPDRIDLPDADLDFMSTRRHEVIEYLVNKYGQARVAGVSNFGTLAAASAMRDVGRTAGIPEREYSVSKMVPKKHGANVPLPECREEVPEIDAFANNQPVLWPIMEKLEGKIRNFSSHAAGIVVAGEDLTNRAVVERRKDNSVVCWDKRVVEDQGLVKVDILGLSTLDLIGLTLEYIKERHGARIDMNRIHLDNPDVLKNFAEARTTGIFQFESGGMRRLLKELGYNGSITFEDITAATALYRPGPMESGMMDSFYKRKQGEEDIEYDHALMEQVLETTYGVIVYQEQVMKVSQIICGYTGAEADKLRKIMGKKQPEEMAKQRDKFVSGAVNTVGADEKWAGQLFDKIEGFAGYAFNLSHSVEYTLISYQSMWLKTNYPVEFYAAALTLMDEDKLPGLIKDARDAGIVVDMPDINHSTKRFEIVTDKRLAIPFQRIKGISEKTAEAIMTARAAGPFADKEDFIKRVERRRCNVRHQDALDRVGAFANIEPGQLSSTHPERVKDQIELIPGLISAHVPIDRELNRDKDTRAAVTELVDEYRNADTSTGMPVKPSFGRSAKFMIVSDAPGNEEDVGGLMGFSRSNEAVVKAMDEHGLQMADAYWTALLKRPKKGRMITPEEIAVYKDYLDREINMLKPPVIVLLGSTTTRHFLKDFRGKASDQAGKVVYNNPLDTNLVIGFSAGEIYHDPEKQNNMNAVFAAVADLLK